MPGSWLAFEGAQDLSGDPATVEFARLCADFLACHEACHLGRVERYILTDGLKRREWIRVAPADDTAGIGCQSPVSRHPFPFADRTTLRSDEMRPQNIIGRDIKSRRTGGLKHTVAAVGGSDNLIRMKDFDTTSITHQFGWSGIVPNRFLAALRFDGKSGSALAVITPHDCPLDFFITKQRRVLSLD